MGRVVEVLRRSRERISGLFYGPPWRLECDDDRVHVSVEVDGGHGGATAGHVVVAEIVRYPASDSPTLGVRIVSDLGHPGSLQTEVERLLALNGVQTHFSAETVDQVKSIVRGGFKKGGHAGVNATEGSHREDLKSVPFYTIDPSDAKDHDDAVYAEEVGNAVRVSVAIADVSHYVSPQSPLDLDARRRGCSIYLPDRVIPMLPKELSADLCSLLPGVDRLALVVTFTVTPTGSVSDPHVVPATIRVRAKLNYDGVARVCDDPSAGDDEHRKALPRLRPLQLAASWLRAARQARGGLDLELPEAKVVLDESSGRVQSITSSKATREIRAAYRLVEDLMIAANEAIGRLFLEHTQPTIWRIHAPPDTDSLVRLGGWLSTYGIQAGVTSLGDSKGVQELLHRIQQHVAARPLGFLVLRSLKQAAYSAHNSGHFGLASEAYVHFTSPIRRYPDLVVHRLVKALVSGTVAKSPESGLDEPTLRSIAGEVSRAERAALDTERAVHSLFAAAFMADKVDHIYQGRVVSLTSFGVFVSLQLPFVEGLIAYRRFDERMEYDEDRMLLRSEESRWTLRLGDEVTVRLVSTNLRKRHIDFELVEIGSGGRRGRGRGRGSQEGHDGNP